MRENDNKPRTIAIYARVSTEHEQQMYALNNQIDWYNEILEKHPNWTLYEKYIDRGITGTSAKKRPQFMQMISDAKMGKFDLIITREVSRFARNTVDTLQYTRDLKKCDVEVYFVSDNIWTCDPDGELRLTIMATLAQDESRKTSIRVKAGQRTSMEKGVFFQNGSILGYDFDKSTRTMKINEEQATTVRMIFNLYNSGLGVRKIQWELEQAGRKTATGKTRWDASVISRCLKNPFYCGRITWYKQYVPDFLEQKKINNHGGKEQFTVMGSHEPIVSEEEWDMANARLNSKRRNENTNRTKKDPSSVWSKKLQCSCGSSFNRVKWHTQKTTGITQYGYQCYNRIRTGSVQTRLKKGLSIEGICETPEIAEWKLEAMALYIFKSLSINREHIISLALDSYEKHINDKDLDNNMQLISSLKKELDKLNKRLDNLIDLRADGEISKDKYIEKKIDYETRIIEINKQLDDLKENDNDMQDYQTKIDLFKNVMEKSLDFANADKIPDYVIDAFVESIVVDGNTFKWKFNLLPNGINVSVEGRKNKFQIQEVDNTPHVDSCSSGSYQRKGEIKKSIKIVEFIYNENDAKEYALAHNIKRLFRWRDMTIQIYI